MNSFLTEGDNNNVLKDFKDSVDAQSCILKKTFTSDITISIKEIYDENNRLLTKNELILTPFSEPIEQRKYDSVSGSSSIMRVDIDKETGNYNKQCQRKIVNGMLVWERIKYWEYEKKTYVLMFARPDYFGFSEIMPV